MIGSDLWALGILAFQLSKGLLPFETSEKVTELQMFENISLYSKYSLNTDELSGNLANFIHSLLDPNVETRLGFGGVKKGFENIKGHALFKDVNWMNLQDNKIASPLLSKANSLKDGLLGGSHEVSVKSSPYTATDVEWFKNW